MLARSPVVPASQFHFYLCCGSPTEEPPFNVTQPPCPAFSANSHLINLEDSASLAAALPRGYQALARASITAR